MSTTETPSADVRKQAVRVWEHTAIRAVTEAAGNLASLIATLAAYADEPAAKTQAWQHAVMAASSATEALQRIPADIEQIAAFRMAEEDARDEAEQGEGQ